MSKFDLTQKDIHREVNRTILSQKQEQICSTKNAQFPENCVEIQFLAERILLVAETCSETTKRQFVQYVWYAAMKYKICLILVTHGIKLGISFQIRLSCIYPLALGLSQVSEECLHFVRYFSEFDLFRITKYRNFKSDFFLIWNATAFKDRNDILIFGHEIHSYKILRIFFF